MMYWAVGDRSGVDVGLGVRIVSSSRTMPLSPSSRNQLKPEISLTCRSQTPTHIHGGRLMAEKNRRPSCKVIQTQYSHGRMVLQIPSSGRWQSNRVVSRPLLEAAHA